MLEICDAVCVSPLGDQSMEHLARSVGFRSAGAIESDFAPRGPICFYLIDCRVEDRRKSEILARVRASLHPNTRFSPLIILVGDCAPETILGYVKRGFDDIIALPEQAPRLAARLETHLAHECHYYETENYFGPDRRRTHREPTRDEARSHISYFDYKFMRDPVAGITPVRAKVPAADGSPGMMEVLHELEG